MNQAERLCVAAALADILAKRAGISHDVYFTVLFKALAPWERKWRDMLARVWDEERRIIIRNLKRLQPKGLAVKGDSLIDSILYPKKRFVELISAETKALLVALIENEGTRVLDILDLDMAFDVTNPNVTRWIADYAPKFSEELEAVNVEKLRAALTEGMEAGESIPELMARVNETYDTFDRYRAEMIARSETSRAANEAALDAYRQSGVVTRKVWMTAPDCCDECAALDGTVIGIEDKFFESDYDVEGNGDGPPLHPNCYDDQTDVYTERGWTRFGYVGTHDRVLTIDPEDKTPRWIVPTSQVAYHYRGDMIRFHSRSLDMMVTPDHEVVYRKRWDKRMGRGDKLSRVAAKDLPREAAFPRGIAWSGQEPESVNIGILPIPAETFCRFMGYWLSEGSVNQRTERCYQIAIAQYQPAKYETMRAGLAGMPLNVSGVLPKLYVFSVILGQYLMQFGKSPDKYVPQVIKDMSPRLIGIFLDAYCLGDGSIKRGKSDWKGGGFSDQRTFFTASRRMADDLGELILKIGHRPSFSLQRTKGVGQQFRNGFYSMNHDVWRVTDCPRVWSHNFKTERVPYDGMVYCLDVPPHHTLWVRRNGKTVIGGNCRCAVAADID